MQTIVGKESIHDILNRFDRLWFDFAQQEFDICFLTQVAGQRLTTGFEFQGEQVGRCWNGDLEAGLKFIGSEMASLVVR